MIVIITYKEDYTADFIINKLNKAGIAYQRLNCEDILNSPYSINFYEDTLYTLLGQKKFDAVWFRRTRLPNLNRLPIAEKAFLLGEIEAFIQNLFCVIDTKWISDPFYIYKAENKFLQLREAIKLGFNIPETLITNNKEELERFYHDNQDGIIIKPIAQSRINYSDEPQFLFTNVVTPSAMESLREHDLTPCIFQKKITKMYELRITVVGDAAFSAAVYSQDDPETMIDWRRKKLRFYKMDLPEDVEKKCIELVKVLQLKFGAIDLIKDTNGQYIFLEINPNGQWAWIESETGLPISDAIIKELLC